MGGNPAPRLNFDKGLWKAALEEYKDQTGDDLADPRYDELFQCSSVDNITEILQKQTASFELFRRGSQAWRKIRGFLAPLVQVTSLFIDAGAEATSNAGAPGGKAIFGAVAGLLQATKGVSQSYDAVEMLFVQLQRFLERMRLHGDSPAMLDPMLRDILVSILINLLQTTALATKLVKGSSRQNIFVHALQEKLPRRSQHYVKALIGDLGVQRLLDELRDLVNEENRAVNLLTKSAADAIQRIVVAKEVKEWLCPSPQFSKHSQLTRWTSKGVGTWIQRDPGFIAWRLAEVQGPEIFWINGKPGSGKSVLCSSIVDILRMHAASEDKPLLAYFYIDFHDFHENDRDRKQQPLTARDLLATLVFHLASRSSECLDCLMTFYSSRNECVAIDHPNTALLFECVRAMLQNTRSHVYIIIDALDEWPRERRWHDELFFALQDLVHLDVSTHLRLLLTSRPDPEITAWMDRLNPYYVRKRQLELHSHPMHIEDIDFYIRSNLPRGKYYRYWPDDVTENVTDSLIARAGGMFLWVYLQLSLLDGCTPADVEKAAYALHQDLDKTFEHLLSDNTAPYFKLIFECIAFAERSLTPNELAEVLTASFSPDGSATLSADYRFPDSESILQEATRNLIQIRGGSLYSPPQSFEDLQESLFDPRRTVGPFHSSIVEYMRSREKFAISAHTTLSKLCLSTLLLNPKQLEKSPLRSYATQHWHKHVLPGQVASNVHTLLSRFLLPTSRPFFDWRISPLHKPIARHNFYSATTPFYWAAFLDLQPLAAEMLRSSRVNVNQVCGTLGSALCAAAGQGHLDMLRLLLKFKADANVTTIDGKTVLHFAARGGHRNIVAFLINKYGADPAACDSNETSTLHYAALHGNVGVVTLLLLHGAPRDACNRDGDTALHFAARGGQVEIVKLFLEEAEDSVDPAQRSGKDGRTALHIAAAFGNLGVCRILLEHNQQLANTKDSRGRTPLHHATRHAQVEVARLLLDRNAGPNLPDNDGLTALHLAARYRVDSVARVLLNHGANTELRDQRGYTVLHLAAQDGSIPLAKLLLEHRPPIDREAQDSNGQTALHLSLRRLSDKMMLFLLSYGADPNACDNKKRTVLHHAVLFQPAKVSPLLSSSGRTLRLNARDEAERTALHHALNTGRDEIVSLLLDAGATPVAPGGGWEAVTAEELSGYQPIRQGSWSPRSNMPWSDWWMR